MALTKVTYAGDGSTTRYTIPFPYLLRDHVQVSVSGTVQTQNLTWRFFSDTEIEFFNAPVADAPVEIRRVTDRTTRLVDFENGAVLTEEELDLAHKQHFYIGQELQEEFDQWLGAGLERFAAGGALFEGNVGDIVNAVASEVLASDLYSELQARINDIDLNAESILQIGTIDGQPVSTVVAQDRQARIDGDTALQSSIDTLALTVGDNTAAIQTEATNRASADSALSDLITTLQTTVDGNTASISTQASSIDGLEAQYTVKVDVNGHVAGYGLAATAVDGTPTSEFIVVADKFAVARPGGSSAPFVVDGGSVYIDSAFVRNLNADVITAGTIDTDRLSIDGAVLAKDGSGRLTVNGVPFSLVTGSDKPEAESTRGVIDNFESSTDGEITHATNLTWADAETLEFTLGRHTMVELEFTAMFRRVGSGSGTQTAVRVLKDGVEIGALSSRLLFIGGGSFSPFTWRKVELLAPGTYTYKLQFKPPLGGITIGAFARVLTATLLR